MLTYVSKTCHKYLIFDFCWMVLEVDWSHMLEWLHILPNGRLKIVVVKSLTVVYTCFVGLTFYGLYILFTKYTSYTENLNSRPLDFFRRRNKMGHTGKNCKISLFKNDFF